MCSRLEAMQHGVRLRPVGITPSAPGLVAAGTPETAQAGARMLALGGCAVDAVCAASFAAFVAEGLLCSPAGAGAAIVGSRDHGVEALDFFAAVPGRGLDVAHNLDFRGIAVDFGPTIQTFHCGRGAAAVPGALDGLLELHRRRGRLPLREVVAPAVEYARSGYRVGAPTAYVATILRPILELDPTTADLFLPGHAAPKVDSHMTNEPLAHALEQFARSGAYWIRTEFHPALIRAFGPQRGGRITATDLASYRPKWRNPLECGFAGLRFLTNPPPSSGGALIALGLRGAERIGLPGLAFHEHDYLQTLGALLSALDQARDGGFDAALERDVPTERLLDAARVDRLSADTARELARSCVVDGQLGSTTHISVIDNEQGFASLTMSNGEGSGYTLGGLGIHVNNFCGEQDINPRGFHRDEPGTRMTTMMAPSAVLDDNGIRLVLGSGGSNRIRSAILQTLLAYLPGHRSLEAAVGAARLHIEGQRLWLETGDLPPHAVSELAARWPNTTRFEQPNLFFGGVHAVARERQRLVGVGDPRRCGVVC